MDYPSFKVFDYSHAITSARELVEDLSFSYVSRWKQANSIAKVIGFLTIHIPREIVHAAGMLPVGILAPETGSTR